MKIPRILWLWTLILFSLTLHGAGPIDVSLIRLIATPNEFEGKFVRVIGFVRLEFEGDAVYVHEEDHKRDITKNGLWLDVPDEMRKRKADFDQKYVLLEGVFTAKNNGHKGLWSGSIGKISRFDVWKSN